MEANSTSSSSFQPELWEPKCDLTCLVFFSDGFELLLFFTSLRFRTGTSDPRLSFF
eukprot:Gb_31966 [translate_table: standard]